jgi:hypothetical protein
MRGGALRAVLLPAALVLVMELILLACLIGPPNTCQEERLRFSMEPLSGRACMVGAPPLLAQWSSTHPAWRVARWRCGVAGAEGYRI